MSHILYCINAITYLKLNMSEKTLLINETMQEMGIYLEHTQKVERLK